MKIAIGSSRVFWSTARGLCLGLVAAASGLAAAQSDYPSQPIRFLVPQAAGGSTDSLARDVGSRLLEAWGQPVVVENRPGANGIIGTDLVAKARPDGYTLLIGGTGSMAINPTLYPKLPYDPVRGFVPVAMFGYSTSVLVVNPAVPVKTIGELISYVRARPGQVRYASAGIGSSPHLTAEMFRQMTGVDIQHVPYKGSTPGVVATISGETGMMFTGVASVLPHIRSGRVTALSISGPRRSSALPEVPTAHESGLPGFEADFWIGLFAPAGTPEAIVTRLNTEVNRALAGRAAQEKFVTMGADPMPLSLAQFGEVLRRDIDRWAATIRAAGVTAD